MWIVCALMALFGLSVARADGVSFAWPRIEVAAAQVAVVPAKVVPGERAEVLYRNHALPGRSVRLHLGFNGWGLATSETHSVRFQGRRDWFVDVPMSWDPDREAFVAAIAVPPAARALHFAFCWDDCGPGKWDNNEWRDYGWPVVFPYVGPLLSWNRETDPASGVVVSFEDPMAMGAWLELWPEGMRHERIHLSDGARVMHRFVVTGLRPGGRYRYRVGAGSAFVSQEYGFRTHDGSANLSFIALSDIQDGGEWSAFSKVRSHLLGRHSDALFFLFAGDFPWDDRPGLWWNAFDSAREVLAGKVFMPVPGNHDTPTTGHHPDLSSFRRYFDLPYSAQGTGAYRFRVGPARFFALNSESLHDFSQNGAQYHWLRDRMRELRKEPDAAGWVFAYWHTPPWDVAARHSHEQWHFRAAADLLPGVVDWHFSGHEHFYQRMKPIGPRGRTRSEYGLGEGRGTGFTVLPPAGAWPEAGLHSDAWRIPWAFAGLEGGGGVSGNGFVRVDIMGLKATLSTWMVGRDEGVESMRVVDGVEVMK